MRLIFLILGLFISGCFGKRPHDTKESEPALPQELVDQAALYCAKSEPAYKGRKYVHSRCDGAGFTSLYKVACGTADLSVFDRADGHLYRDPLQGCYVAGGPTNLSASDSSKDMVLMRMQAAWDDQDLVWTEKFIAYGEKRQWVICDAVDLVTQISRCALSPDVIGLLYDMRSKMKGGPMLPLDSDGEELKDGLIPTGSDAHLQVLRLDLTGQVRGGLTDKELDTLRRQAERQPRNAFFSAIYHMYGDGDQTWTYTLLRDPALHPTTHLPMSVNRCEEYLYQRDDLPKDWAPCEPVSIHSGTDFSYVVKVLGRKK